jgi:signal transduction histidine kinase
MESVKTYDQLLSENSNLRQQLEEANEIIDAIRSGQIDALVVHGKQGHELYTLKTADQTYRVFIEKVTEGAVTLNRDGIVIYSNSQFASTLNIPLSRVLGENFDTFISEEYKARFKNLFEKGWKEDCKGEITLAGKNYFIPFQLSLTTLQLDEGISLSIILTDLSAQKETQKQLKLNNEQLKEINYALELSNNDLQQFASVASHDLQEPLRKIQIYSNMLKSKHFTELTVNALSYLEKIISSSSRMSALITNILDYSRLSADDNEFTNTDLKLLVTQLLDDFEIMIKEKKAIIIVEDLPCIDANSGQLRQVFQNLISNALKFSKNDTCPFITIKTKETAEKPTGMANPAADYCSISIEDNGIGFDEKYKNNIFLMFKRLHNKDQYAGTGIGLSITKKIIEKHSGTVVVKSKEGEGSEFIIVLPVQQNKIKSSSFSVKALSS